MPKAEHAAPKRRDITLPECTGCSQCGDAWEDHLYALGHNGQYYCRACFQKIAVKWPKGASMPKPKAFIFMEAQRREAIERGTRRRKAHEGKGHPDYQISKKDPLTMDIEGAFGEVAAKAYFESRGLSVEMPAIDLGGKGDGGRDLIVGDITIAIKTVRETYNLLEPAKQPFHDDQVIVLVWSDFDHINQIVGWTTGKLFHQVARQPMATMHPDTTWMRWQDLRDIDELVARLQRRTDERSSVQA